MSLTKAVLTSPDENPFGKPVYVRGVLYLDDVPEDDSANDAGDSSVDKPGDADNEEPENGGGNNDADLPPEREEAPSEYENDGNTATIGYGELKTLMNIRVGNAESAERITVYKKDTLVEILQFCSNGWLRIRCLESDMGFAYVSNEDGIYATVGRDIYTVKDGDTFKSISVKTLGDESRYEEIKMLNGMKDNVLSVGLVLLIP